MIATTLWKSAAGVAAVGLILAAASGAAAQSASGGTGTAEPGDETFREEFLRDFGVAARKFVSLAEAVPDGSYEWRPTPEVASVGEVFVHVARYNYYYPESSLDVAAPGDVDTATMEDAWAGRPKADIVAELQRSMEHVRTTVSSMTPADLEESTRLYGRTVTARAVLLQLLTHMHEHLGQSIAYARSVGVVPPWSR